MNYNRLIWFWHFSWYITKLIKIKTEHYSMKRLTFLIATFHMLFRSQAFSKTDFFDYRLFRTWAFTITAFFHHGLFRSRAFRTQAFSIIGFFDNRLFWFMSVLEITLCLPCDISILKVFSITGFFRHKYFRSQAFLDTHTSPSFIRRRDKVNIMRRKKNERTLLKSPFSNFFHVKTK